MPELPDITVYIDALTPRVVGRTLESHHVRSPFVLRSVTPPLAALDASRVVALQRLGKRIVLEFERGLFLVIHLMVGGRLKWLEPGKKSPGKIALAEFDFGEARLLLTEASKKKRASLHVVDGRDALRDFDRGGLDVLDATPAQFAKRLRSESHTLKRALTDPTLFDGIGNSYSDEILHRAKLSPLLLTSRIDEAAVSRLYDACRTVLREWIARLREQTGDAWPEKVTAFRPEMAVHGRYRLPCPVCGSPVQRIRYAENETNYCATCQTGGKLLADRGLSRLLKDDWPRSIDEYDGMIERGRSTTRG
ncbi:MAG TPA: DNA-formamidopyrimidine glycosylase family protein [Gemmatimonadaceae bacterium]|nr:DNA-formamidopyrimidine glycosylase family protein [Gemmatimonadaceae bacterium]